MSEYEGKLYTKRELKQAVAQARKELIEQIRSKIIKCVVIDRCNGCFDYPNRDCIHVVLQQLKQEG